MTSLLSRIALLAGRRPRITTLAVLLALVAVVGGATAAGGTFKDDFTVPGIESQRAQDLLEQRFPGQSGTQATVVFGHERGDRLTRSLAAIERAPHVSSVTEPREIGRAHV